MPSKKKAEKGNTEKKPKRIRAQASGKVTKKQCDDGGKNEDYEERLAKYEMELERDRIAPVDDECPRCLDHHVYWEGEEIYEVMLKKSSTENMDKEEFFVMQLVEASFSNNFAVWTRWGVAGSGCKNQTCWTACGQDGEKAKSVFKNIFSEKTQSKWEERDNMQKTAEAGKFIKVDMDRSIVKGSEDEN